MSFTVSDVQAVHQKIVRRQLPNAVAQSIADMLNLGTTTMASYKSQLIGSSAPQCTTPALLVSAYFEGVVPASTTLDNRAWFCQQQYDAYVLSGVGNPALGPYEALGQAFSAESSFAAKTAGRTLSQVIGDAYVHAFLTAPSTAAELNLTNQYNYFNALYLGAGDAAAIADRKAKGAVIGQIIGYAGLTVGNARQNAAVNWLYAASNGTETYGTPL